MRNAEKNLEGVFMNNKMIKIRKYFLLWQLDKKMAWLNQLGTNGYKLIRVKYNTYYFIIDKEKKFSYFFILEDDKSINISSFCVKTTAIPSKGKFKYFICKFNEVNLDLLKQYNYKKAFKSFLKVCYFIWIMSLLNFILIVCSYSEYLSLKLSALFSILFFSIFGVIKLGKLKRQALIKNEK